MSVLVGDVGGDGTTTSGNLLDLKHITTVKTIIIMATGGGNGTQSLYQKHLVGSGTLSGITIGMIHGMTTTIVFLGTIAMVAVGLGTYK